MSGKHNIQSMNEEEIVQYFTELACDNPERLPFALLEMMKQRLISDINRDFRHLIENCIRQFEEQLKRAIDERKGSGES